VSYKVGNLFVPFTGSSCTFSYALSGTLEACVCNKRCDRKYEGKSSLAETGGLSPDSCITAERWQATGSSPISSFCCSTTIASRRNVSSRRYRCSHAWRQDPLKLRGLRGLALHDRLLVRYAMKDSAAVISDLRRYCHTRRNTRGATAR